MTDEPSAGTLIQLLTTEESVLQSVRASTISESTSRATIFLGSVSSGLIAVALTAQVAHIGTTFYVLALTVLPTVALLGVFTYVRIMQSGIEDLFCAAAIGRIRRRFGELHPGYAAVIEREVGERGVAHRSRWQLLFTAATMVSSVTSVLAGSIAGLSLSASGARLGSAMAVAIPVGMATFAVLLLDQRRRWIQGSATVGS